MQNTSDNQFGPTQPENGHNFPWEPYYESAYPPNPAPAQSGGYEPAPAENNGDLITARRHFSRLGLGTFTILIVGVVAQVLVMIPLAFLWPGWMEHSWGFWLVSFLPLYAVAIPIGFLILRTVPAQPPERIDLRPGQFLTVAAVSIFMMYAGSFVGSLVAGVLQNVLGITVENPVEELVIGSSVVPRILVTVILAPIIEEFIFRKQLIDRMRVYGSRLAVVLSALMFGLFHGNLSQLFYAAALGLVFGYVYQRTGKMRYSVALHMLINFMGSVIAPVFLEHMPELEQLETMELTAIIENFSWMLAYLLYAFVLFGGAITGLVLLCVNFRKLTFAPAERKLPRGTEFQTACLNVGMILLLIGCVGEILLSLL